MALPTPLQLQTHRWSILYNLSPTNHYWLAPCPMWTPELILEPHHDHIHASPVSQTRIQTYELDPDSYMHPSRRCIQSMKGMQLSHTWGQPEGIASTPWATNSATDNHSTPQQVINTMWQATIYFWHPSHSQAPSAYFYPQCIAFTIPGQTTLAGKPTESRSTQPRQFHKFSHSTDKMTTPYCTTRLE